jgi:hypothetical protein
VQHDVVAFRDEHFFFELPVRERVLLAQDFGLHTLDRMGFLQLSFEADAVAPPRGVPVRDVPV